MTVYRNWLLRLVFPFPYGRLLTGVVLICLLVPLFHVGAEHGRAGNTPALFFSLILAYIIPVFSYITARTRDVLFEMKPILALDEAGFNEALARIDSASLRATLVILVAGLLLGLAHISVIQGSVTAAFTEMVESRASLVSTLGTVLVWVVMNTVISMLIRQALLFARLGARVVRVSLLNTRALVPFARVAITSSLAMIGALALFPLMSVDSDFDLVRSLPGIVAIMASLLVLFIIPVWPLHRRIARRKEAELLELDTRIDECLDGADGAGLGVDKIAQLTPLLNYRREISAVSTWPFDAGAITRLAVYLVIVPLTWAGAALIERLVDAIL